MCQHVKECWCVYVNNQTTYNIRAAPRNSATRNCKKKRTTHSKQRSTSPPPNFSPSFRPARMMRCVYDSGVSLQVSLGLQHQCLHRPSTCTPHFRPSEDVNLLAMKDLPSKNRRCRRKHTTNGDKFPACVEWWWSREWWSRGLLFS